MPGPRPPHHPDALCALEAAAVAARHARMAALARLAAMPDQSGEEVCAFRADLPWGYVERGALQVAAIEGAIANRFGIFPMIFHYSHRGTFLSRAQALALLEAEAKGRAA